MQRNLLPLLFVATLALTGCATSIYRSPGSEAAPISQLAVLEYNGTFTNYSVNITEVDGKHRGRGFFRRYEVPPGQRSLLVSLGVGLSTSKPLLISFAAEAGATYELKYEILEDEVSKTPGRRTGTWRIWIEDRQSGATMFAAEGASTPS